MTLMYSLYLAIGSIAFFIFINGVYTTLQARICQYSDRFMVNSITLTCVSFFASILLFFTCFWILKKKKIAKISGLSGLFLLIIYPIYIIIIDLKVPYSFNYIFIMCIPAIILLIISIIYWRKIKN